MANLVKFTIAIILSMIMTQQVMSRVFKKEKNKEEKRDFINVCSQIYMPCSDDAECNSQECRFRMLCSKMHGQKICTVDYTVVPVFSEGAGTETYHNNEDNSIVQDLMTKYI